MRLGMIVRADFGRGLAQQSRSFYEALHPDVTVVVDNRLIDPRGVWAQDLTVYPDGIITEWLGLHQPFLNPDAREALATCDVVYSAETFYDERIPKLTRTVLHVNLEFFWGQPADRYWYPTTWRTDQLPPGTLIPTPIPDNKIATGIPGPGKLLHVAGHRAIGDRNGTTIVGSVVRTVRHPWKLASQDGIRLHPHSLGYVERAGSPEDNWTLYDDAAVLVAPRRYGGQSLVVNEAMARGLAVVMSNCPPNIDTWPIIPIPARPSGRVNTQGGIIIMQMVQSTVLADMLHTLMGDQEMLERWQARSLMWARDNAWSVWEPEIRRLLEDAAS